MSAGRFVDGRRAVAIFDSTPSFLCTLLWIIRLLVTDVCIRCGFPWMRHICSAPQSVTAVEVFYIATCLGDRFVLNGFRRVNNIYVSLANSLSMYLKDPAYRCGGDPFPAYR